MGRRREADMSAEVDAYSKAQARLAARVQAQTEQAHAEQDEAAEIARLSTLANARQFTPSPSTEDHR